MFIDSRRWVPILVLALGSSCGAAPERADEGPERAGPTVRDEELTLAEAANELDALVEHHYPNCGRVCALQVIVCQRAQAICEVAAAQPDDELGRARCRDAEVRCAGATDSGAETCGCVASRAR